MNYDYNVYIGNPYQMSFVNVYNTMDFLLSIGKTLCCAMVAIEHTSSYLYM